MAVSVTALTVALGGTGYAAVSLPSNSVGAGQIKTAAVRSSEVRDGSLLRKDFKAGQVPAGPVGPAGAPGQPGARGAQGEPGAKGATGTVDTSSFYTKAQSDGRRFTTAWVVFAANGTITRQSGGFTVTRTEAGRYVLSRPGTDLGVAGFAASTFREPGAGTAAGFVSAYASSPDIVVRSSNTAGTQVDGGVSLVVPLVDGSGAGVGGSG